MPLRFLHIEDNIDALKMRAKIDRIKLVVDKNIYQDIYEALLEKKSIQTLTVFENYVKKENIELDKDDDINKKIEEIKKEEINNKIDPSLEFLKNKCENSIGTGTYDTAKAQAKEKGFEIQVDASVFEQAFNTSLLFRQSIKSLKYIEEQAGAEGIRLGEPDESLLKKAYKQGLASGNISFDLVDYATERGVELDIKDAEYNIRKELFENIYLRKCIDDGSASNSEFNRISELAKKSDVEIDTEKIYIDLIHNTGAGHADMARGKSFELAKEHGSKITYADVIKMNYLDYLNIPKDERIETEKNIDINGEKVRLLIIGQIKDAICKGKFVLGEDNKAEKNLVFDATLGEHNDMAQKYNLKVSGGGWLSLDQANKTIKIFGTSQKFGQAPREYCKQIIKEAFPDYVLEEA
ncbi:MAG: hypothetical protein NTY12_03845 [Candidatus Falkowbacteria bacterium]|nr:hypothetical protein [Candidatus Falkowbacteria bacterium]